MTLSACLDENEVVGSIGFWQKSVIVLFVLYLLLAPVLILLFRRHVQYPLRALLKADEELTGGNETYHITQKADSAEFYDVFNSFNNTVDTLHTLRTENLERQIENQQLQLDYLRLQIRPHFLLNTFNLLYALIQNRQAEPAQNLILYLSDYFRYMFRSGSGMQPFSRELELIREYMEVCRISYPDGFTVSYQLDPILDNMPIPPLLLHSFFENIIHHALVPDRVVHIVFYGEYEDGLVTFCISDDGKGMDAEERDTINRVADAPVADGRNVGIRNSVKRLKSKYGDRASVFAESEPDVGTTFTVTIPCELTEDDPEAAGTEDDNESFAG